MSEHLIAARAALADEIADAQGRIDRANAALAALGATPLARPPAPDVEQPAPVIVPKRETRPKPVEQRPAASNHSRKKKHDYDEIARIAREAIERGESAREAVATTLGLPIKLVDTLIWKLRKIGYDIPKGATFTAEPITRMPVDEQAIRDQAAGPSTGPVQGLTTRPHVALQPTPLRPLAWTPEMATEVIEAVG